MPSEEELTTNAQHPIIRIGDTVHRPTSWWTPAVHDLLDYLESVGFAYSPRVLGFDEVGREVLSFIPGASGKEGWYRIHSDVGLENYARLLRDYHDAVRDYQPTCSSLWACASGGLQSGEIVCHGDFGPWNLAWEGDTPVGIIDWDVAIPAPAHYDVFYALEYAAPFRNDTLAREWHHFSAAPNRSHRIDVFLQGYNTTRSALGDLVTGVAAMQRFVAVQESHLAARGMQPQVDWVAAGDLDVIEERARWTESHRHLFE